MLSWPIRWFSDEIIIMTKEFIVAQWLNWLERNWHHIFNGLTTTVVDHASAF